MKLQPGADEAYGTEHLKQIALLLFHIRIVLEWEQIFIVESGM